MGEVRLSPPLTILSIISVSLGALAWNGPPVSATAEACEAALVFAQHEVERSSYFDIDVFAGPPLFKQTTLEQLEDKIKEPHFGITDPRLLDLLRRSITENRKGPLEACVDLRAYADRVNVRYDKGANAEALDYNRENSNITQRSIDFLAFKLPVISANGKQAVVESTYSNSFTGPKSSMTYLMKKGKAGHWQVRRPIFGWFIIRHEQPLSDEPAF